MRTDKPMVLIDGSVRCGTDADRHHVCQYHEGWLDAMESARTLRDHVPTWHLSKARFYCEACKYPWPCPDWTRVSEALDE